MSKRFRSCSVPSVALLLQCVAAASALPGLCPVEDPVTLTLNVPVRRELRQHESHTYLLQLNSGDYVCVIVNQVEINLALAFGSPDGRPLVESKCRQGRATPLSLIAETSGTYTFQVLSIEIGPASGSYEVRVQSNRPVKPGDRERIGAERLIAEGERLRAEGDLESSRRAIRKYESALPIWRAIGDKQEEARTLRTIGQIRYPIGEPKRALEGYRRVLSLARETQDHLLEGQVLADIGYLYIQFGDYVKAGESCSEALRLSRDVGDRTGEAQALNNIGKLQYAMSDRQKALDYYGQSLSLWRSLNDRQGQAQTLLNLGYVYSDLRDKAKASDLFQQALALWRAIGNRRGEAMTITAIGNLYSRFGQKQDALDAYIQGRRLSEMVGDPIEEGRVLLGFATIYKELHEEDTALVFYNKALARFRSADYRRGEASATLSIGEIYYSMKSYKRALAYLQNALLAIQERHDQMLESYTLNSIAAAYESLGYKKIALAYYNRALDLYRVLRELRGEAYALSGIASVYDGLGKKQEALEYLMQALRLNIATQDRFGKVATLFKITRLERDLGRLAEARVHIADATREIESLRTDVASPELRASFLAALRQDSELHIDVLMRSHKERVSDGFDAAALQSSERGRARSLVEMLAEARADIRASADTALLARETALRTLLSEKADAQSRLLGSKHPEEHATAAAKEIETITTEYQQVQSQIRAASPRYAALTQPQPLTLEQIQKQVLDRDTLLLEYALGEDRSYLWAVTTDSLFSFELPKRADIEAPARRLYQLLTAANKTIKDETAVQRERRVALADSGYSNAAADLSQMLLGPVASQLGKKRLLIVADGALQYIPFSALPTPSAKRTESEGRRLPKQDKLRRAFASSQPLIVEHEVVSLPSASVLAVLRRELADRKPAPKAVAVLADPVFSRDDPRVRFSSTRIAKRTDSESSTRDFERAIKQAGVSRNGMSIPRLPFSRREAEAITGAAPAGQAMEAVDFDASRAKAMSAELSQYRVVHFATHGLLNSDHPELSGIVLSLVDRDGRSQNGFLRLHEVYNLNLPAELVVLSACQTALGKEVKGEGLIGLTRGFMYAGAARVMASLWKVDDSATAELMKRFYAKMLGSGLRPAAALRDAQVEMWKQKRWQTPYHWAGFVLQGEWK